MCQMSGLSFPGLRDGETRFGWAGWKPNQRAAVLMRLIDESGLDADDPEKALPLLAGLREQVFWIGLSSDIEARAYLARAQAALGVSDSDLINWRPPRPRRGRPRKNPAR